MRHFVWLMAAGLCMLSACSLTTPAPNEVSTPSAIATVIPDQPAPTISNTTEPQATSTPTAKTVLPLSTPGVSQATKEPPPNQAIAGFPKPAFPYGLQSGTPALLQNFINTNGCNYLGVGGQVLKLNGDAVSGLVVEITGTLSGKNILNLALTGNAQNLGPGGYEIKIGDQPVASNGTLKIQVFDLSGQPQTPLIAFETFADCNKNFILVNFSEQYTIKTFILLPFVGR
jgi:hypothetical protein